MSHTAVGCCKQTLAITLAIVAGCMHPADVHATFPVGPPGGAGSVAVVLNEASSALSITIGGQLVVDRAVTRHAQIDGVPAGMVTVESAAGGRCERAMTDSHEVEVIPGRVTTIALPGPEPSTACQIGKGLSYVGYELSWIAIALLVVL